MRPRQAKGSELNKARGDARGKTGDRPRQGAPMTLTLSQKKLVLFLSGMNLMIIQFVMIRTFSSILSGTEIVVMIVAFSIFAGHSAGYFCSDRISVTAFKIISLLVLALHLPLPFSIRYLSGLLFSQGAALLTLLAAVFVSTFCLSSYYSLLLPRFIAQEGRESLRVVYRQELIGALASLFLIFASTLFPHGSTGLMVVYLLSLSAILHCFWRSRVLLAVACSLVVAYIGLALRFEAGSVSYLYSQRSRNNLRWIFRRTRPTSALKSSRGRDVTGCYIWTACAITDPIPSATSTITSPAFPRLCSPGPRC